MYWVSNHYSLIGRAEAEEIIEKTEKTDMRMLKRIKSVTLRDKIKSVDIKTELAVNITKVREIRLHWYGHRQRMEENNEVREIIDMIVPGKRPRCEPRGRWMDCNRRDMQELRISPGQNILEIKNSGR